MAKAKFDKLIINETSDSSVKTHRDLQKRGPGRPKGSTRKNEPANASISISLTPSQKRELEEYAKSEFRSSSSVIKLLLIKNGIITNKD